MTYVPGGGSGKISTSSDVALNNPANKDVLSYDPALQKWVNLTLANAVVSTSGTNRPTNGGLCLFTGADPGTGAQVGDLWIEPSGSNVTPTRPSEPTSVTFTKSEIDETVVLNWQPPATNGGSSITGYYVARDGIDSTGYGAWSEVVSADRRSYTFGNMASGNTYNLTLYAINANGNGASVVTQVTMSGGAPSVPTSVVTSTNSTTKSITINWQSPATDGGSAISGYFVGRDGTDAAGSGPSSTTVSGATRTYTFNNLVGTTAYTLTLYAINANGNGQSVVRSVTIDTVVSPGTDDAPAMPTIVSASIPATSWVTDFVDDFNDYGVTAQKWNLNRDAYHTTNGWWTQDQAGMPTGTNLTTDELEVVDGAVWLKVKRKSNPTGKPFTNAIMTTGRASQTWGEPCKYALEENGTYFVEGLLWNGKARGTLSGFWLLGDTYSSDPYDVFDNPTVDTTYTAHWDGSTQRSRSAGWPTGGEIDILEFAENNKGEAGRPYSSLHWARDGRYNDKYPGSWLYREFMGHPDSSVSRPELQDSWHTWGMYRSPTLMVTLIDGVELCRWERYNPDGSRKVYTAWDGNHTPNDVEWTKRQYLFLSYSIGGGWGGDGWLANDLQEGKFGAKYVKVWKKT